MILKVFSVYDSAAEAYLTPFFAHRTGQAIRSFSDVCRDPDHQFSKNVSDFSLFEIGKFDDQTAILTVNEKAELIMPGVQYKKGAL